MSYHSRAFLVVGGISISGSTKYSCIARARFRRHELLVSTADLRYCWIRVIFDSGHCL